MSAVDYWTQQFSGDEEIRHHSLQNQRIANDFLQASKSSPRLVLALRSPRIIEIGCGTGEFSLKFRTEYNPEVYYPTDFCREIVKRNEERIPMNFWVFDILNDRIEPGKFDLALASNVLEHFKDPYVVIEKMFKIAPQVLIIGPYNQPVVDGYDAEGGAGHVFRFDEHAFKDYDIIDFLKFKSSGWTYSSQGEPPVQFAALIHEIA